MEFSDLTTPGVNARGNHHEVPEYLASGSLWVDGVKEDETKSETPINAAFCELLAQLGAVYELRSSKCDFGAVLSLVERQVIENESVGDDYSCLLGCCSVTGASVTFPIHP